MDGWNNFFVAMAGAAVAFAGLVLVSVSINLDRIIKQPGLVSRSAAPLIVLFVLFVASSIVLVPDQRIRLYGYELLGLSVAFGLVIGKVLVGQRQTAVQAEESGLSPAHSFWFRVVLCSIIAISLLGAGVTLATGRDAGVFLLVPAAITGFLFCFMEAWVLLIEIDR